MEDDKIKDLFCNFRPDLGPDALFMAKLEKSMEAIELVRRHTAALRRRNRIAVAVAAFAGFAVGVALTLLFPFVGAWCSTVHLSIPTVVASTITIDWRIWAWIIIAGVCIATSVNAYEITLARLDAKASRESEIHR